MDMEGRPIIDKYNNNRHTKYVKIFFTIYEDKTMSVKESIAELRRRIQAVRGSQDVTKLARAIGVNRNRFARWLDCKVTLSERTLYIIEAWVETQEVVSDACFLIQHSMLPLSTSVIWRRTFDCKVFHHHAWPLGIFAHDNRLWSWGGRQAQPGITGSHGDA